MPLDSIPLVGGLDLISHEQNSKSGALRKCSNFERGVVDGYARIDGHHAVDGVVNDVQMTFMRTQVIRATWSGIDPEPATVARYVAGQGYAINGVPVRCIYSEIEQEAGDNEFIHVEKSVFAAIAERIIPAITDATITIVDDDNDDDPTLSETPGSFKLIDTFDYFWGDVLYSTLLGAVVALESEWAVQASTPPGQGQVYGLHFFKNQQYAIREYRAINVTSDSILPADVRRPLNGDLISNEEGTWTAEVVKAFIEGNLWGNEGDEGRIILRNESGTIASGSIGYPGEVIGMLLTGYPMGITPIGADIGIGFTSFAQYVSDEAESEGALHVATSSGWVEVDMLREVPFRAGAIVPGQAVRLAKAIDSAALTATTGTTGTATTVQRGWYASGGSPAFTDTKANDLVSLADVSDANYSEFNTSTAVLSIVSMRFTGFDFSLIPDSSTILGIEVGTRQMGTVSTSTNNIKEERVRLVGIGSSTIRTTIVSGGDNMTAPIQCTAQDKADTASLLPSALAARTFGGPKDLWGETSITSSRVRDLNNFGVWLEYRGTNGGGNPDLRVSYLRITVYYQAENGRTYVINATGTAVPTEIKVVNVSKTSGAWDVGTAAGVMTIICDKDTDKDRLFADGDLLWENNDRTGDQYLTLAGPDYPVTMPGRDTMDAASKQFEFINENFYADSRWSAFYGVTGVSQAFMYDGIFFVRIFTELLEDKPVCLERHHKLLALGFDSSVVLFSAQGDPLNFVATDDSFSREFGSPVTNMKKMVSDTLGVFCRGSIHSAIGTDVTLQTRIISSDTGCFPYTARNVSGRTVGVDNWGLFVVDTTDRFGDFVNGRLSKWVSPFIVKRTQERGQFPQLRPHHAQLCRAKNQYRLLFGEGTQLTATFTQEGLPEFTIQHLPNAPICSSSEIDDQGRERIAMSLEWVSRFDYLNESVIVGEPVVDTTARGKVLAVDSGHSFDGTPITAYIELSFNDNESSLATKKSSRLVVYGQSDGTVPVAVSHAVNNGPMVSFGIFNFNPSTVNASEDLIAASMTVTAEADFFSHSYRFETYGYGKVVFQYMIDDNTPISKSQGNLERGT